MTFEVGGQEPVTDEDSSDGWSAVFDMTASTTQEPLVVTAIGPSGSDVFNHNVDILTMPDWFYDAEDFNFSIPVTFDYNIGYDFDIQISHLDLDFNTPLDWVFSIPGINEPLFDLAVSVHQHGNRNALDYRFLSFACRALFARRLARFSCLRTSRSRRSSCRNSRMLPGFSFAQFHGSIGS